MYYSTPEKVIQYTGIRPEDLAITEEKEGKTPDEQLEEIIETWLVQVKDLIDADRNRDFHAEVADEKLDKVPPLIENVALRMAANMVAQAQLRRETPIVRHDDFSVDMVEDKVMTSAIKSDLKKIPFKSKMRFIVINGEE